MRSLISLVFSLLIANTYYNMVFARIPQPPPLNNRTNRVAGLKHITSINYAVNNAVETTTPQPKSLFYDYTFVPNTKTVTVTKTVPIVTYKTKSFPDSYYSRSATTIDSTVAVPIETPIETILPSEDSTIVNTVTIVSTTTTTKRVLGNTKALPNGGYTPKTIPPINVNIVPMEPKPKPTIDRATLIEDYKFFCTSNDDTSFFVDNGNAYYCFRQVVSVVDGEYVLNTDGDRQSKGMPCIVYNGSLYCIDKEIVTNVQCKSYDVIEVNLDSCLAHIAKLLNTTMYSLVENMPEFTGKGREFANPNRPGWNMDRN